MQALFEDVDAIHRAVRDGREDITGLAEALDERVTRLIPLSLDVSARLIERLGQVVRLPQFATLGGGGLLIAIVRESLFSADASALRAFTNTLQAGYPRFRQYSACYNAIELLVDTLPPEEALSVLMELAGLTEGEGRKLVLLGLSWLHEECAADGVRQRIRSFLVQAEEAQRDGTNPGGK